jgi:hypothetical protein
MFLKPIVGSGGLFMVKNVIFNYGKTKTHQTYS